jgi:2-amino-4-hydroxy-6-hydroxymethyldihydropteridine diphosphokinase
LNGDHKSLHTIYVSVGSNIDKIKHTQAGIDAMRKAFGKLQLSSVYESESVGFEGHNFYNMAVKAYTKLSVAKTCSVLKQIEHDNDRQRADEKFAPRTLDLDLLLYDDEIIDSPVVLPRPEILYNAFVLWPMAEIAGDRIHPIVKQSYQSLWDNYDKSQQRLWAIDFKWSSTEQ